MPPEMKRQNAFNEEQPTPFKTIACRICYEVESCGDWKRITCQCSIIHDYYHAHEFCLNRVKQCKICHTPFIEQKPSTTTLKGYMIKIKYPMTFITTSVLCLLFIFNVYQCTSFEQVDQTDLPDLATNESIWLPVFQVECFQKSTSIYYYLILVIISFISFYL